ncbi:MAG: PIN domain-containing protein [Ornithinimicrobium sp.]
MTAALLDANVLIALVIAEHEHHDPASTRLGSADGFALCTIVEGALIRTLLRSGKRRERLTHCWLVSEPILDVFSRQTRCPTPTLT